MYEIFIADCKREMRLRRMTNGDLAKKTGFKRSTIDAFFADLSGREKSENVAKAISVALGVEI
ncbi:MAG: helix-turn-helix transcriptional regulator [Clostridia bacterium]|nr:helix-turn-helix transcriptional regulator [Clostridia bacterium]